MVELAMDFSSDTNARLSCANDSIFCHLSGGYCDRSTEPALDAARVVCRIFECLAVFIEVEKAERKARLSSWNQGTTALNLFSSPHWGTPLARHTVLSEEVALIPCVAHHAKSKCLGKQVQTILWLHSSHND